MSRYRNAAPPRGGSLTVIPTSKLELQMGPALDAVSSWVIGHVRKRVSESTSIHGRGFARYSEKYRKKRIRAGRAGHVSLLLSGGLMNHVREASRRIQDGARASITIAPGETASPRQIFRKGHLESTSELGPEHSRVGYWLHVGTAHMPARPWLGIAPRARPQLRKFVLSLRLFRLGRRA
jgi:hypothetical protein